MMIVEYIHCPRTLYSLLFLNKTFLLITAPALYHYRLWIELHTRRDAYISEAIDELVKYVDRTGSRLDATVLTLPRYPCLPLDRGWAEAFKKYLRYPRPQFVREFWVTAVTDGTNSTTPQMLSLLRDKAPWIVEVLGRTKYGASSNSNLTIRPWPRFNMGQDSEEFTYIYVQGQYRLSYVYGPDGFHPEYERTSLVLLGLWARAWKEPWERLGRRLRSLLERII